MKLAFLYAREMLDQSIWWAETPTHTYIISRDHIHRCYMVSVKRQEDARRPFKTQHRRVDLGQFTTWKAAVKAAQEFANAT